MRYITHPDGTPMLAGDMPKGTEIEFDPATGVGTPTPGQHYLLIVEDYAMARQLLDQHFKPKGGAITYACTFPKGQRADVIAAIDNVT